jgi:hypothetical protein
MPADTVRIKELEDKLRKLNQEKLQINIDNADLIKKASTEYVQEIKAARSSDS